LGRKATLALVIHKGGMSGYAKSRKGNVWEGETSGGKCPEEMSVFLSNAHNFSTTQICKT